MVSRADKHFEKVQNWLQTTEALLGVIGIRDIWVNNYRDTGYLGGKLKGYGIFLKRFWDIEDRSYHFLKESNKFISQYRRRK